MIRLSENQVLSSQALRTRASKIKAIHALQFVGLTAILIFGAVSQAHAQPFVQVAAGDSHICALDTSGQIECTATRDKIGILPPPDLPLLREISAGQEHTCGVTLDNTIECFGNNIFNVLDVPTFDWPVVAITSGATHNCAVDSTNQVQCWGLNSNNQLDVPDVAGGFIKVDASRTASCGIDTVGDIHCWTNDAFFNPGVPVTGPFIDLDTDSNQACGLTAGGDIECFASRERANLQPPTNGPYTDLTVTNSAICGLNTDQLLDCSFAAPTVFSLDAAAEDYPIEVPFSSIERSSIQFNGVPICGIRADDGAISCFGGSESTDGFVSSQLPEPPGSTVIADTLTAADFKLGLIAEVYGEFTVELFWNNIITAGDFLPISIEVFRNDELVTTTTNGFSLLTDFISDDTGEDSIYRIRAVDELGNVGEFSNAVVISPSMQVTLVDEFIGIDSPRPVNLINFQSLDVTAFPSGVNDKYILTWRLNNPTDVEVAGFEVRFDNDLVAFVDGNTYIGDGVIFNECHIHSVAAIGGDGAILDFASVAFGLGTDLFGVSSSSCRSVP